MIVGEREMMTGVEPTMVGVAKAREFADVDHGKAPSGGLSQGKMAFPNVTSSVSAVTDFSDCSYPAHDPGKRPGHNRRTLWEASDDPV
jgi:hypothetical protein